MKKLSHRLPDRAGTRIGRVIALLAWLGAATGCALPPDQPPARSAPAAESPAPAAPKPVPAPAPAAVPAAPAPAAPKADAPSPVTGKTASTLPSVELTRELVFQILASEIAAQRGQYGRAAATYQKLARETRDPRLARRATELALAGRSIERALPAAELWHELDPASPVAEQTLETLWVSTGRFSDAEPLLRKSLAQARADGQVPAFYQKLQSLLTRVSDKSAAFEMLERLASPDRKVAEARLALAAVAFGAGHPDRALAEARAAMALKPRDTGAAIAAARYAQDASGGAAESQRILSDFLKRNPRASDARFLLARMLVADKKPEQARAQFEAALANEPNNPGILFSLAQLAYQTRQPALATDYLKRYIALPASVRRDNAPAYLFLGQIAEEAERYEQAAGWYARVRSGEQFVPAVIRRAVSLGKLGRIDEARKLLRDTAVSRQADRVQLTLAEAQVLRNAGRNDDAFETLGEALKSQPDNQDLLYDQAMVAEKLDRLDVLEHNLRRIIALRPENAHAYNALGYTLADRGQRLDEARSLIEKALSLAPDDAHIEDSMGWVLFRLGELKEAEKYLRSAYARRPEVEIAAHLGEVLWAQGRHDDARKLWQDARGREPDNETLKDTLARLNVSL